MKHICLILLLVLGTVACYAQDDIISLANGLKVRKGDTLTLGPGKRPDGDYIHIYTRSTVPLDKGFRPRLHIVKDIQVIGNKKRGETRFAIINPTGLMRYFVDVNQAIESGEITKVNRTEVSSPSAHLGNSAADELIKLKGLLDAGAITQQEYDSQKKKVLGN